MAPASSVPPLPPSVEEAYRRKCIQLKQRTREVEEANEAANMRLNRLKRQVEKMRLERAFLLEQLARRTTTNVEDSDGTRSPSPMPQDKPLRIKRGHRKTSLLDSATPVPGASKLNGRGLSGGPSFSTFGGSQAGDGSGSNFVAHNLGTSLRQSPSSDVPSKAGGFDDIGSKANGLSSAAAALSTPKRPAANAYEFYSIETRKRYKGASDLGASDLAQQWDDMTPEQRGDFEARYELEVDRYNRYMQDEADDNRTDPGGDENRGRAGSPSQSRSRSRVDNRDGDVEMGNYDTDPDEAQQGEQPGSK